jgi:hypothetical protein
MALPNDFQSNVNKKLLKSFIKGFESSTVLTNTVSKQLVNEIDSSTGGTPGAGDPVAMKRPTQYVPQRTPDGNMSTKDKNPIRTGKVVGNVSENGYITVFIENTQVEEALETDQLDELMRPVAEDMVVECESELAKFMTKNAALVTGNTDTAINKWSDIANAGALFKETGAPAGKKYAAINCFDETVLADLQTQLGVNPNVNEAWAGAVVKERFAGLDQVLTTNNLDEYTSGTESAGLTLQATPSASYTTYKDSYQMSLAITGATPTTGTLKAGQQLQFASSLLLNLRNRKIVRKSGNGVPITLTVLQDAIADGSGNMTVLVSGAAINETDVDGAYNTVSVALQSGDSVTVLGTVDTAYRPALAYCEGFVGMGSVVLPKLHALDSMIVNHKGMSIRMHKFSDGVANINKYRFDILPTFACFNPFWGMQMFGS